MKKNKIIICCFGNHMTGFGHVARSVNLLNYFIKKYSCDIFTNKEGKIFCNNVLKQKKNIYKINNYEKIFLKTNKNFSNYLLLIGVADKFDLTILKKKKIFTKIINIGDIFIKKNELDISIILNDEVKYSKSIKKKYNIFAGEKYNFVNPIFFKNKKNFYNIKDMNVLINFGSTDVKNYTIKILKILSDIKFFGKIIIIITSKSNNYRPLISSIKNFENLNISLAIDKNQKQLSNIYNKCLLCIGSGGNSLFERLASNLYSIVIPSNKLEEKSINYNLYSESVLFIKNLNTLNVKKLNNILIQVLKKSTLDNLGHQQRKFDDKGIERIERIIFDL